MKKRVYVMAVMIAVLMSFSNLTVNAQEKVKLNAASKEKTLEVTLELPVTEKGIDAMAGTLDYDHAKLELTEMKAGDSRLQEPVYNSDNGKFTTVIKSETIKESVNAVQFVFKKKADAAGETIVRVSELTAATAEDTKQMLDAASVTITLGDTTKIRMIQRMIRQQQIRVILRQPGKIIHQIVEQQTKKGIGKQIQQRGKMV